MSYTDDYLEYVDLIPVDPDPERSCSCECHDFFDPDGLACLDGYCELCGGLAGGDQSKPIRGEENLDD